MVGKEGNNLEICLSRLPENEFWASEQLKMFLKYLTKTADIFDKSHNVAQKLHENWKRT